MGQATVKHCWNEAHNRCVSYVTACFQRVRAVSYVAGKLATPKGHVLIRPKDTLSAAGKHISAAYPSCIVIISSWHERQDAVCEGDPFISRWCSSSYFSWKVRRAVAEQCSQCWQLTCFQNRAEFKQEQPHHFTTQCSGSRQLSTALRSERAYIKAARPTDTGSICQPHNKHSRSICCSAPAAQHLHQHSEKVAKTLCSNICIPTVTIVTMGKHEEDSLLAGEGHGYTPDTTRAAVIRSINFKILPIFLTMATLCYIDRTNTAFASLQMNRDLKFSPETYGLGSGLFFIGYSLSMIPSQLILVRVGAPRWLAFIVIGWGLTAMSFAAMNSKQQFWILRVCLGMFESGAFPGMWHYLNSFYPPDAITLPYSLIEAAVGAANVAGAPLAAGLLMLDGKGGWSGWRWLFLLEGIPSVCTGIAMLYLLPKDFQSAKFLTPAGKSWLHLAHALNKKQHGHDGDGQGLGVTQLLFESCRCYKVWLVGLAALLKNAAIVGILFWCPIIVNSILLGGHSDVMSGADAVIVAGGSHGRLLQGSMQLLANKASLKKGASRSVGEKGVHAVLLTAIPFVCAAICAVLLGHRSQQKREKCKHIAAPYCIAAVLFMVFPYTRAAGGVATFVCLVLAITSLTAPNAILNSLASSVSQGPASAVSLALYNSVGNLGSAFGPWLIGRVVQATGTYAAALQMLGVMVAAAAGLCWWFRRWKL